MVVRMRATRSHRNNRRSHHALDGARIIVCSNCKNPTKMHTMCANCGYYKGRQVIDVAKKAVKKAKKTKSQGR